MRVKTLTFVLSMFILTACLVPNSAFAQKGGKGGGKGGGGGSDPSTDPAISYRVEVVDVTGLKEIVDVNDHEIVLANIWVDATQDQVATSLDTAGALLDRDGNVMYLDNLIPADSPWDLYEARLINNAGWIAGVGLNNGSIEAFLLVPSSDPAGYTLTGLGEGSRAGWYESGLSENGDLLFYRFIRFEDGTGAWDIYVRLANGDVNLIRRVDEAWQLRGLNSFGFMHGYIPREDGSQPWLSDVIATVDGDYWYVQTASSYWDSADVQTGAENGLFAGFQTGPTEKHKGYLYRPTCVAVYDATGQSICAAEFQFDWDPINYMRMTAQEVDGVPAIVGFEANTDEHWLLLPGQGLVPITNYMDAAEASIYASLGIEDDYSILYTPNSDAQAEITTPRLADGSVDQSGAPAIFGNAHFREWGTDQRGYQGFYVLRPVN